MIKKKLQINEKIMYKALNLCKKNLGKTWPNPVVGCIITDNDHNILSTAITGVGGRPHAETLAIKKLKNVDSSFIIYITLEPCSHQGITMPCTDAIIASGIKNIIIATQDPYFKVNGSGIKKLQDAGLSVIINCLKNQAILLNSGFFLQQILKRPTISVKIATSLDGKIACENGNSKWITNEKSRKFTRNLRSQYDAILTTNKTVLDDNPLFKNSIRIIIDRNLSLKNKQNELQIFSDTAKRIILFTGINENQFDKEVETIYLPEINLTKIFQKLGEMGFTRIFVESGGIFITSLLKENLIDKFYWLHASKIIGNDGRPSIQNLNLENVNLAKKFHLQSIKKFDNDVLKILINLENLHRIGFSI